MKKTEEVKIRLNKYISNSGLCSRRTADEYIAKGWVKVNGVKEIRMGVMIGLSDQVEVNGKLLKLESKVYVLLNKPKNYVTTTKDPQGRSTVMDLVANACPQRLYPVGRLDRNTTGLLLLTNDGELTKMLSHPSYVIPKLYLVGLDKNISQEDMQKLRDGVTLEDGFMKVDEVSYSVNDDSGKKIGLKIHSGKNRIVRRLLEHLGYEVLHLDRVIYAGLTKKGLARGHWRFLKPWELGMLKKL